MPHPIRAALPGTAPLFATPALADGAWPRDGRRAPGLLRLVEDRADLGWLKEFERDDDGPREVEHRTPDGAARKVRLDARTGQERRR